MRLGWFLVGLIGGGVLIGCCAFSAPRFEGPVSDHFDGRAFKNQDPIEHKGAGAFLEWQLTADRGPWQRIEAEPGPPPPKKVGPGRLRVTFINHATTLVQLDGKNILTDPVWSERVSPVSFAGPSRYRPPGIRFEDLPPIDAVVISHNHYDHLDMPTLKRLQESHSPSFFVGLGNAALLRDEGIAEVVELDWWQSHHLGALEMVAVPAQHFSGRGLCDRDGTLWVGWALSSAHGLVYFAGDTGMGPHFKEIRQRLGEPRLAILPIGAYLPRWFMELIHIDPAQAVEAHRILGAFRSVAMHFGTFALADEAMDQAPRDLAVALEAQRVSSDDFWVLDFGEGRDVPAFAVTP
jgi:L-ascorbate metabolism protein UlaG (beta-lactamase superfamily)